MRVTKESSDAEALDGEGNCKDIKTVKAKDKITISRFLDCAHFSSKSKKSEEEFMKRHHSDKGICAICLVYSLDGALLKLKTFFYVARSRFKMELQLTAARIPWR